MHSCGILYDSLPMMRLGVRDNDEQVVVAPDFSTMAYMLEEYIALGAAAIVIPATSPEARRLADMPSLLQKRVKVIEDGPERDATVRLISPLLMATGVKPTDDGHLRFPKGTPHPIRHSITVVQRVVYRLSIGFNHGLQVGISPPFVRGILRDLRSNLSDRSARTLLAQIEGILATYGEVSFQTPQPNVSAPIDLISVFDRLINDPLYLALSDAVTALSLPQKRRVALSRVRECARCLVASGVVAKGWNLVGKVIEAWTGKSVPEAETLLAVLTGKHFPVLVDLRSARKRAIAAWLASAGTMQPVSGSGNHYQGLSWIVPAGPPKDWDGGEIEMLTFGTVSELKRALEKFAQQGKSSVRGKPRR